MDDGANAGRGPGDNGVVNRLVAVPLSLVAGLLFTIGVAVPASAHTQLIGVDPAEGATVAADGTVTLTFSEDLLAIGAEATVTDSAGVATKLEVRFPTPSSAQVVLPSMAGGNLTLAWRVVAGDGHPVEGTLAYVADAPAQPSPPPASATPSATASAAVTPSTAVSASPGDPSPGDPSPSAVAPGEEGDSSGFTSVALWIAIFGAVFVSSVAIVAAKRRP